MTTEILAPVRESDNAAPLYPPLQVWKVALLMIATLTVYSMAWFYRAAKDVRAGIEKDVSPWMWVFAPLLGGAAAIAGGRLAGMLRTWAVNEEVEVQKQCNPGTVGALILIANLLLVFSDRFLSIWWLWLVGIALLIVPFLLMQQQLNAIKLTMESSQFRSAPMRYTGLQKTALAVFGLATLSIGGILAFDIVSRGATQEMTVGTVLRDSHEKYQLEINISGWNQVEVGYNSDDGDFEFVSDYPDDWAVVFSMPDTDMDSRSEERVDWIRDSFATAKCKEKRHFLEEASAVVGTLDCFGSDVLYGHYHYRSRVIANDDTAVEVFIFIAAETKAGLEERKELFKLAEGLTML